MSTVNILHGLIAFLAPVIAIALVIFCLIQGFRLLKGNENGSVAKLVSGVLLILFILGVMYLAGSYETYGHFFENLSGKAITQVQKDAGNILGGEGGTN